MKVNLLIYFHFLIFATQHISKTVRRDMHIIQRTNLPNSLHFKWRLRGVSPTHLYIHTCTLLATQRDNSSLSCILCGVKENVGGGGGLSLCRSACVPIVFCSMYSLCSYYLAMQWATGLKFYYAIADPKVGEKHI